MGFADGLSTVLTFKWFLVVLAIGAILYLLGVRF